MAAKVHEPYQILGQSRHLSHPGQDLFIDNPDPAVAIGEVHRRLAVQVPRREGKNAKDRSGISFVYTTHRSSAHARTSTKPKCTNSESTRTTSWSSTSCKKNTPNPKGRISTGRIPRLSRSIRSSPRGSSTRSSRIYVVFVDYE